MLLQFLVSSQHLKVLTCRCQDISSVCVALCKKSCISFVVHHKSVLPFKLAHFSSILQEWCKTNVHQLMATITSTGAHFGQTWNMHIFLKHTHIYDFLESVCGKVIEKCAEQLSARCNCPQTETLMLFLNLISWVPGSLESPESLQHDNIARLWNLVLEFLRPEEEVSFTKNVRKILGVLLQMSLRY